MTKKFLIILLIMAGQLLTAKAPTRLALSVYEEAGTKTYFNEYNPPEGVSKFLFEQEAAPVLLNANFARLVLTNKLNKIKSLENFNLAHWQFYILNLNDPALNQFVLSIPTSYADTLKDTPSKSLGFNQAALKRYTSDVDGITKLLKDLGYDKPFATAPYANSIKNLFDVTANVRWTIYIEGHGRESLHALEKSPITSLLKRTKTKLPAARIADVSLIEFLKLIEFFSTKLDVQLLLLDTCFGPGYHAETIKQVLNISRLVTHVKPIDKPMAIAICGQIADASTGYSRKAVRPTPESLRSYGDFFSRSYTCKHGQN